MRYMGENLSLCELEKIPKKTKITSVDANNLYMNGRRY